jgi:hypothetical protein
MLEWKAKQLEGDVEGIHETSFCGFSIIKINFPTAHTSTNQKYTISLSSGNVNTSIKAAVLSFYLKGDFPKCQQTNPPQHAFVPRLATHCHEKTDCCLV